ncbi:MAG: glycogen phosphorylase [Gammaproteobacteria bacterium]|nr:MAG: glycogen phosphorylase [Gammaproteobacteria bacterium]
MNFEQIRENFRYNRPQADTTTLEKAILEKLIFSVGRHPEMATPHDWLNATVFAVRDLASENWISSHATMRRSGQRSVFYLSMEFLMGRILSNALIAEGIYENADKALKSLGQDLETLIGEEADAGLGNGGLGRLASCFLDAIATLGLPAIGYGIRYEYGMFTQEIINGEQHEKPDAWLDKGIAWEYKRHSIRFPVRFGGHTYCEQGRHIWAHDEEVVAVPFDYLIPGYDTDTASTLRLWEAHASSTFDLQDFNRGDYHNAIAARNTLENISRVLYPNDSTQDGKVLRLRQEYFLVSASLQDIIHKHKRIFGTLENLGEKVGIHLNDTHPVLAVPELLHILLDQEGYTWEKAWKVSQQIFSYTNHTLMSEALETWPVEMLAVLLPRHLQIIFDINEYFLQYVRDHVTEDADFIRRVSIIDENYGRKVRMAWLAVVASYKVNGVAALHSELMVNSIFADFARIYPHRFTNVTNGVTPRRWMRIANPALSTLLNKTLGPGWVKDLSQLDRLNAFVDDDKMIESLQAVKKVNKQRLFDCIEQHLGMRVNPESLVDTQIKRIHEYKRQLLNIMHVIARYNAILDNPDKDWVPRLFVFSGKAASSYTVAKNIIRLINDVATVINNDERVDDLLKVVFIPNYSVSLAQLIIPATDLSEQISLAGTEASGTGNMKFALNGALTIGTLDGANIEILDNVGKDNIFIFGNTVEEVEALRKRGYSPMDYYQKDTELARVLEQINSGYFSPQEPQRYHHGIYFMNDYYQVAADFRSYVDKQEEVDAAYKDAKRWTRMALINIANMGYFSADRSISEYARHIWNIKPIKIK